MRAPIIVACLLLTTACAVDPSSEDASDFSHPRALASDEGIVVDGQTGSVYGAGDICVLYAATNAGTVGLVVDEDYDDPPPFCGAVAPYLDRIDVIVSWDPTDLTPITNTNLLQNLSEEFDRPTGRYVDYYWLGGPLTASQWGTVYYTLQNATIPGLGPVCAMYMETDEGTPIGLLDTEDAYGVCPHLEPLTPIQTIRMPLDSLVEVTDPGLHADLEDAFWNVDQFVFLQQTPTEL